jgi:hypothetical protein
MAALAKFVPTSHILFGTDYFFEPMETTVDHIPNQDYRQKHGRRFIALMPRSCSLD